jgi:hypothetical protein
VRRPCTDRPERVLRLCRRTEGLSAPVSGGRLRRDTGRRVFLRRHRGQEAGRRGRRRRPGSRADRAEQQLVPQGSADPGGEPQGDRPGADGAAV